MNIRDQIRRDSHPALVDVPLLKKHREKVQYVLEKHKKIHPKLEIVPHQSVPQAQQTVPDNVNQKVEPENTVAPTFKFEEDRIAAEAEKHAVVSNPQ